MSLTAQAQWICDKVRLVSGKHQRKEACVGLRMPIPNLIRITGCSGNRHVGGESNNVRPQNFGFRILNVNVALPKRLSSHQHGHRYGHGHHWSPWNCDHSYLGRTSVLVETQIWSQVQLMLTKKKIVIRAFWDVYNTYIYDNRADIINLSLECKTS